MIFSGLTKGQIINDAVRKKVSNFSENDTRCIHKVQVDGEEDKLEVLMTAIQYSH